MHRSRLNLHTSQTAIKCLAAVGENDLKNFQFLFLTDLRLLSVSHSSVVHTIPPGLLHHANRLEHSVYTKTYDPPSYTAKAPEYWRNRSNTTYVAPVYYTKAPRYYSPSICASVRRAYRALNPEKLSSFLIVSLSVISLVPLRIFLL